MSSLVEHTFKYLNISQIHPTEKKDMSYTCFFSKFSVSEAFEMHRICVAIYLLVWAVPT